MMKLLSSARPPVRILLNLRRLSFQPKSLIEMTTDNDGICTVTMQRAPVNSLNLEMMHELSKSLDEVAKNKCKGIVLTSAFPNVFSAGLDINEALEPDLERFKSFWTNLQDVWIKLFGSDFISTAAINGHAPAGGCILALACEYRVMIPDKKIGINDSIIGFVPSTWIVESIKLAIGVRESELALTTSKLYTTEEALKVRLIDDQAKDKEEAIDKCKQFIKKGSQIPSFARSRVKKELRGHILRTVTDDRKGDLDNAVRKILDDRTQNAVRNYFKDMKAKKK